MCEQTVLTAANSPLEPNHFSTRSTRGWTMRISRAKCLKDLLRTPLGPFTVTKRDLTWTVNPCGILTTWFETICFILGSEIKMKEYVMKYNHFNLARQTESDNIDSIAFT